MHVPLNARLINVNANDLMTNLGKACGGYEADITGSNNSDRDHSGYLSARH
jgi:hypothetical protein